MPKNLVYFCESYLLFHLFKVLNPKNPRTQSILNDLLYTQHHRPLLVHPVTTFKTPRTTFKTFGPPLYVWTTFITSEPLQNILVLISSTILMLHTALISCTERISSTDLISSAVLIFSTALIFNRFKMSTTDQISDDRPKITTTLGVILPGLKTLVILRLALNSATFRPPAPMGASTFRYSTNLFPMQFSVF